MAATVAAVTGGDHNVQPGLKFKFLTVTMPNAYVTVASGGVVADVSSYFPTAVLGAIPATDVDGWLLGYELGTSGNPATGLIRARNTTSTLDLDVFPEVSAAKAMTGVAGRFLFIGY